MVHVLAGAPPGSWELAGSWTYSTNVAEVVFTGLGKYQELAVFAKGITLSASGLRFWAASADNGSTWITGSGKYTYFDTNGSETDLYYGTGQFTASSSARSFNFRVAPWGVSGAKKIITGPINSILEDTSAHNALRMFWTQDDYSTPVNATAGSIAVWGRVR